MNKRRKVSLILGIIEYSNIYFLIKILIGLFATIRANASVEIPFMLKALPVLEVFLIVSIIVSGLLYFLNKAAAYYMYYVQIIFRFIFSLPSFGLLLKLNYFFDSQLLYKMLIIVCVVLEIIRLVCTIMMTFLKRMHCDSHIKTV